MKRRGLFGAFLGAGWAAEGKAGVAAEPLEVPAQGVLHNRIIIEGNISREDLHRIMAASQERAKEEIVRHMRITGIAEL